VVPYVTAAGHTAHPVTLPGLESADAPRAGLTLQTAVDAVRELLVRMPGPVALVAHSAASTVANAVIDADPASVERVVYVDTFPVPERAASEPEFPAVGDGVPLPDWSVFAEGELKGLTAEQLERLREIAVPVPTGYMSSAIELHDERRHAVPLTIICTAFPASEYARLIGEGHAWMSELAQFSDVTYVDLDTGHWPQFTKPRELGEAIVAALA
jgi:pimeloyl-ACP methyl ester carboxylesterase